MMDEYAVFSTVIEQGHEVMGISDPPAASPANGSGEESIEVVRLPWRDVKGIAIISETSATDILEDVNRELHFDQEWARVYRDLKRKDKPELVLRRQLTISKHYQLVPPAQVADMNASDVGFWDQFRKTYPQSRGLLNFSRAAFDWRRSKAMVSASFSLDSDYGIGVLFLLEKKDSRWSIVDHILIWVS
jgi:hypothetical protein